ncbi:MAG: hypothetical protein ACK4NC_06715 [Candidatus Gracilibacteria bacterium]
MALIRKDTLNKEMLRNAERVATVSEEDFTQLLSLATKKASEPYRWIFRSLIDDILDVLSTNTEKHITEEELDITLEGVQNAVDTIDTKDISVETFSKYVQKCIKYIAQGNIKELHEFRKNEFIDKFHLGGYFYRKDNIASIDNGTANTHLLKRYIANNTVVKPIKEKKIYIPEIINEPNSEFKNIIEKETSIDSQVEEITADNDIFVVYPEEESRRENRDLFLKHLSSESKDSLEKELLLHKVVPAEKSVKYLNPFSLKNASDLECTAEIRDLAMLHVSRRWDPFKQSEKMLPREQELRDRLLENLHMMTIANQLNSENDKRLIGKFLYEKNHILLGHIRSMRKLFTDSAMLPGSPGELSLYIGYRPVEIATLLSEELAYEFFPQSASYNWHSPVSENNFYKDVIWGLLYNFFPSSPDLEQFLTLYLVDDFSNEEDPDQYELLNARNRRTLEKQTAILKEITMIMDALIVETLIARKNETPSIVSKETIEKVLREGAVSLLGELEKREVQSDFFMGGIMDALLKLYKVKPLKK